MLKSTPFTELHRAAGAKMAPFAGYDMPVEFEGIKSEHLNVREKVGIFDVSHMGEFMVTGPGATAYLQYITSNDVEALFDGKIQYTCFPTASGGIVDDLLLYRYNQEKYLLVVNASNIEKDWNHCVRYAEPFGIVPGRNLVNVSDDIAQVAVQGPLAIKVMEKLTDVPVAEMEYYTFRNISLAGIDDLLFSITGYTGSGGCEIYVPGDKAGALWERIMEAGEEFGIKPAGLGARDTLRLESGFCLYGNDIDETTSPLEAGLGWITKLGKSSDMVGKDFLVNQKEEGVRRRLKGFVMVDRGIPRKGYEIVNSDGDIIGEVTSGTMSPMINAGIGMAYLNRGYWPDETEIFIRIRGKELAARVVKPPFYKSR